MLLINEITVHDGKADLASEFPLHRCVGWQARADAILGILIRTGSKLKTVVEEPAWVVLCVAKVVSIRQREETSSRPRRQIIHINLIVVGGASLQLFQRYPAGVVVLQRRRRYR